MVTRRALFSHALSRSLALITAPRVVHVGPRIAMAAARARYGIPFFALRPAIYHTLLALRRIQVFLFWVPLFALLQTLQDPALMIVDRGCGQTGDQESSNHSRTMTSSSDVHSHDIFKKGIRFQALYTPTDPPIPSLSNAIRLGLMTSLPDDWEFQLPTSSSDSPHLSPVGNIPGSSSQSGSPSAPPNLPDASSQSNIPSPTQRSSASVAKVNTGLTEQSSDAESASNVPTILDAHAALELQTHNMRVDIQKKLGQTKATDAAYARHVKSYFTYWPVFQQTCTQNGQACVPAEPITAPRVAIFLKHESERKRRSAFNGKEIDDSSVGDKTIEQIINALEDFRKKNQHRPEYFNCPEAKIPLRSDPRIKIFEKQARAERPQRVEHSHEMKAHGMTEATYKDEELIRISTRAIYAFENDNTPQHMTPRKLATALRDREMILLSCSTAFRGDSSRILQLSDLELYQLRLIDQGYDVHVPCVIFIANQGKTNTDGNLERHGSIRHRIPELCCIGGLGFHLFGEFHILQKPTPNFAVDPNFGAFGRRKWYGLHLFRGGNSDYEPLSYDTHLKRTKAIHDEAGLQLKNVTHAGRHYVGETAMYAGASHEGITKLGHWTTMNAGSAPRYMQSLPVDAILAMGGWHGGNHNSYNLIRGKLDVPSSLSSLLFPWIEGELHKLEVQKATYGPERGDDHRLRLFLELLKFLRSVIIQDAAVLFFKYRQCPLWQYAPFNSVPFLSFAMEARTFLKEAELASQVQLKKLPHEIANMLHGTMGTYNTETTLLRAQVGRLEETLQLIARNMGTKTENSAKRTREQEPQQLAKRQKTSQKMSVPNVSSRVVAETCASARCSSTLPEALLESPSLPASCTSTSTTSTSTTFTSPTASTDVVSRSGEDYCSDVFRLNADDRTRNAQLDHIAALEVLYQPSQLRNHRFMWNESQRLWIPQYHFHLPPNGLCLTILDIWTEYKEGIDGQLSVENIEKTWGNEWRKARGSMRTELSKRMKVVNLIRELAALEGWNPGRALAFLKENYVPTKKYPTAKSFIAALQDSKKGEEAKAKEKCKIKAEDIIVHARTIS